MGQTVVAAVVFAGCLRYAAGGAVVLTRVNADIVFVRIVAGDAARGIRAMNGGQG